MVLFYLSIQWDTCMRAIPMSCDISIKFSSLSALESDGTFSRGQSTVSPAWGFAVSGAWAANSAICLFEVTHHPVRAGIDLSIWKEKNTSKQLFKNVSLYFQHIISLRSFFSCHNAHPLLRFNLSIKNLCGPQLRSQHFSPLQELPPPWS